MARPAGRTGRWGPSKAPGPPRPRKATYAAAMNSRRRSGTKPHWKPLVPNNKAADQVAAGPPAAGKTQPTNVAALSDGSVQADMAKSVQIELRRVGCLSGAADGEWNAASQRSMALFNRHAGTRLNVKLASTDALDAIKLKPSRVCPL